MSKSSRPIEKFEEEDLCTADLLGDEHAIVSTSVDELIKPENANARLISISNISGLVALGIENGM